MESLPHHLLDEILFRIDHRSLAMMQCTNRSLQTYISKNPNFESEYLSRVRSSLIYIALPPDYGSPLLCYHLYGDSRSPRTRTVETLMECHILGSCSGLLLLFLDKKLCVANPLTKKIRFLNHSRSKFFPRVTTLRQGRQQVMGFAVDRIDGTTQSYKIVNINEGSLHWLRNDGSIVAFNLKTEKPRLIPIRFPKELRFYTSLFTAADNNLTLISATKEVIFVYALENILSDPKWVVVKQIRNGVLDEERLYSWYPEAYNENCLVLSEIVLKKGHYELVLHGYDLRTDKWEVGFSKHYCSIQEMCTLALDFYQFTPSSSSVIGLDDKEEEEILACDLKQISSINSIMRLIDGISS
ncbi:unnamed protein product [Arabidopsis halleri]